MIGETDASGVLVEYKNVHTSGMTIDSGGGLVFERVNQNSNSIVSLNIDSSKAALRIGGPAIAGGDINMENGNLVFECEDLGNSHGIRWIDKDNNQLGATIGPKFATAIANSTKSGTYSIKFDPGWGVGTVEMSITVEQGLITNIYGSGLTEKPAEA